MLVKENNNIEILMDKINSADAIVIGGGSGLSSAAGYNYYHSKQIIENNFKEFGKKYGFKSLFDAYYYLYSTNEERWGFFSKSIKFMYEANPGQPYLDLYEILKNKPYFILTTNIDMQFSKVFPEDKICMFQGDFSYFQCSQPCHDKIYKNNDIIDKMIGNLIDTKVSSDLIPRCPKCGRIMMPWVRDYEFLEGDYWNGIVSNYQNFLKKYLEEENKKVLFLELGVGDMTPSIIQLPFWKMTASYPNTFYISINLKKTSAPKHLQGRAMAISEDIASVLGALRLKMQYK
ncbi:NAD-dependent protein deacetylase, SIR2 family [Clostridium estertheticum]|uniref:NAD-dependent protein deacetylase, SIR2 family n=1 Tax=Clostridium estertheticum TaxID=238834 RepID=UPI001C0C9C88|nr:NAD-dependent protein deacetylase, SIR2 family [Clostridium estertheticum]MBU3216526.1 NAD-dependent protein deacetylase, SIR2 family [Clostridium estertheticum]WAG54470.1 NAD-dependent protein deacetylase, SIR2 family [Clostridium estertheticum]